jgi:hypothetical protein
MVTFLIHRSRGAPYEMIEAIKLFCQVRASGEMHLHGLPGK